VAAGLKPGGTHRTGSAHATGARAARLGGRRAEHRALEARDPARARGVPLAAAPEAPLAEASVSGLAGWRCQAPRGEWGRAACRAPIESSAQSQDPYRYLQLGNKIVTLPARLPAGRLDGRRDRRIRAALRDFLDLSVRRLKPRVEGGGLRGLTGVDGGLGE
jgi:hypothetical protein